MRYCKTCRDWCPESHFKIAQGNTTHISIEPPPEARTKSWLIQKSDEYILQLEDHVEGLAEELEDAQQELEDAQQELTTTKKELAMAQQVIKQLERQLRQHKM